MNGNAGERLVFIVGDANLKRRTITEPDRLGLDLTDGEGIEIDADIAFDREDRLQPGFSGAPQDGPAGFVGQVLGDRSLWQEARAQEEAASPPGKRANGR